MNDEQFDDLKQFIETTVSQTEDRLNDRLDELDKKIDDGFAGIGDVVNTVNEGLDDHETRITTLEQAG